MSTDKKLGGPSGPARTLFTRRRFLAGAGAAGAAVASGTLLGHYLGSSAPPLAPAATAGRPPLILITLYGGNDGLNTVVPATDPAYVAARPTLGYKPAEVLDLGDGLGLNPRLKGLHSLWQSGHLAVVRGVGYPNPNLSHFASMAIWQTANVADGTGSGWLGRWLDRASSSGVFDPMLALSLGATLPPVLRGDRVSATAITSERITIPGPPAFRSALAALQATGPDRTGLAAAVAASGADLLSVRTALDRMHPVAVIPGGSRGSAPTGAPTTTGVTGGAVGGAVGAAGGRSRTGSELAAQIATVVSLIRGGAPTRVYQVSLSSFDTHADEKADHERLLAELDSGVSALVQGLAGHPAVIMAYSEFGRRPAENSSGGTDHGTAAPLFVIGEGVRGGRFYGEEPSLTSLDANGNLRYSTDFRSVYATVLDRVLGSDPEPVLGGSFPTLPFV